MGKVENDVWENLLLEKIYASLSPEEQRILQMASVCITRTPVAALSAISGGTEAALLSLLQALHDWSLCFFEERNQTFDTITAKAS